MRRLWTSRRLFWPRHWGGTTFLGWTRWTPKKSPFFFAPLRPQKAKKVYKNWSDGRGSQGTSTALRASGGTAKKDAWWRHLPLREDGS
jgi:hypothetical protein